MRGILGILLALLALDGAFGANSTKTTLRIGCITRYYERFFYEGTLKIIEDEMQRLLGDDYNLNIEIQMASSRDFEYISTDPGAAGLRTRIAESILDNELTGVDVVVGGESSDEVDVFSPLLTQRGLFYFSPWATNPAFSDKDQHPNFVRMMLPDQFSADAAVKTILHLGYNKVKVITCTSLFCQGLLDIFTSLGQDAGISVVKTHAVDYLTLSDDFEGTQKIKDFLTDCSETKVVVFTMGPDRMPTIFSSARKLGVKENKVWIGVGHVEPDPTSALSAIIPEGYFYVSPQTVLNDENWRIFNAWFAELLRYNFYVFHFRGFWFDALYSAIYAFQKALNSNVQNPWKNHSAIVRELQDMAIDGINGKLTFNENLDPQAGVFRIGNKILNENGDHDWSALATVSVSGSIEYLQGVGQSRADWLATKVVWPGGGAQPQQQCFFKDVVIGTVLPYTADKRAYQIKRAAEVAAAFMSQDAEFLPGVQVTIRTVDGSLIQSDNGLDSIERSGDGDLDEMKKEIMRSYLRNLVGEFQCDEEEAYRQSLAIVGPVSGSEVALMHELLVEYDLLTVSPAASSLSESSAAGYTMMSRTVLSDEYQGTALAETIYQLHLGAEVYHVISSDDDFGISVTAGFRAKAEGLALQFDYRSLEEFRSDMAVILTQCTTPPAIVLLMHPGDAAGIFEAASLFSGITPIWIGVSGIGGSAAPGSPRPEGGDGTLIPSGLLFLRPHIDHSAPKFLEFLSFWSNYSPEDSEILLEDLSAASAADAVFTIVRAIHNTVVNGGDAFNSTLLRSEVSLLDFAGVSGPVSFTPTLDRRYGVYDILQKQGAETSVIATWTRDEVVSFQHKTSPKVDDWVCGPSNYCPPGLFLAATGACVPCPQNFYCTKSTFDCSPEECSQCPLGGACDAARFTAPEHSTWEQEGAVFRLQVCDEGYILVRDASRPISDQCVMCPPGKYSITKAKYPGRLSTPNAANATDLCEPCTIGADCTQGANLIAAQPDFWMLPATKQIDGGAEIAIAEMFRCPKTACTGGRNNTCREGRMGKLCGTCTDGWAPAGSDCRKCGDFALYRRLGLGLGIPFFLCVWYFFSWRPLLESIDLPHGATASQGFALFRQANIRQWLASINLSTVRDYLKVLIGHFQVVSTFDTVYVVQWPNELRALWSSGAVVRLDFLSLPGIHCLTGQLSYYDRLKAMMTAPVCIIIMLGVPTLLLIATGKTQDERFKNVHNLFWSSCMVFGFMIFPQMAMVTIQSLNCRQIGEEHLMLADLRKQCPIDNTSSWEFILAILGILVYPVGIIAALFILLWRFGVASMANVKQKNALLQEVVRKYMRYSSRKLSAKIAAFVGGGQGLSEAEQRARIVFDGASGGQEAVTREGLMQYLQSRGITGQHEDEVEVLFSQFDDDGNGQLEWDEFYSMIFCIMEKEQLFTGQETIDSISELQIHSLYWFPWDKVIGSHESQGQGAPQAAPSASLASGYARAGSVTSSLSTRYLTEATFKRSHSKLVRSISQNGPTQNGNTQFSSRAGAAPGIEAIGETAVAGREQKLKWVLHTGELMVARGAISRPLVTWNGDLPGEREMVSRLGFVFRTYCVPFWWIEIFELVRKAWMTSLIALIAPNSAEQIAAALLVTLLSMGFYARTAPFSNPRIDKLMTLCLTAQAATLGWGLMLEFWKTESGSYDVEGNSTRYLILQIAVLLLNVGVLVMPILHWAYHAWRRHFLRHIAAAVTAVPQTTSAEVPLTRDPPYPHEVAGHTFPAATTMAENPGTLSGLLGHGTHESPPPQKVRQDGPIEQSSKAFSLSIEVPVDINREASKNPTQGSYGPNHSSDSSDGPASPPLRAGDFRLLPWT